MSNALILEILIFPYIYIHSFFKASKALKRLRTYVTGSIMEKKAFLKGGKFAEFYYIDTNVLLEKRSLQNRRNFAYFKRKEAKARRARSASRARKEDGSSPRAQPPLQPT